MGTRKYDVVIIGGGVMGCAVALRLAQRGRGVVCLERSIPGAEASSAAAGMLAPQQEAQEPGLLLDLGLASRARFEGFAAELRALTGLGIGYRRSGLLALAESEGEREALWRKAAWQAARGLSVEPLMPAALRALEPALGAFAGGLRMVDEAQVDPPLLMRALQLAAVRVGVAFESAWVRRVRPAEGGQPLTVELDGDEVTAHDVVIAAGSWSALVEGSGLPARAVRPVRGQMVELETRPAPFAHLLVTPGGYLVPREDGRVTVGSTMEEAGFRKEVTAAGLHALLGAAMRAVPSLASAPVNRSWSNFRPATIDHLPVLGPTPLPGVHLCTGHFRNGILLTPISAELVAAGVCGDRAIAGMDLSAFSVTRLAEADIPSPNLHN